MYESQDTSVLKSLERHVGWMFVQFLGEVINKSRTRSGVSHGTTRRDRLAKKVNKFPDKPANHGSCNLSVHSFSDQVSFDFYFDVRPYYVRSSIPTATGAWVYRESGVGELANARSAAHEHRDVGRYKRRAIWGSI